MICYLRCRYVAYILLELLVEVRAPRANIARREVAVCPRADDHLYAVTYVDEV